jgi:hypothetical protein
MRQKRRRILVADNHWTAMRSQVFIKIFPTLRKKQSALVFSILFDRCFHSRSGNVHATRAQIARWAGLDDRTVNDCLKELRDQGYVKRVRRGTLRSRTDTPRWKVPLADFELVDNKLWFFVPRFFFTKYCRKYRNAVVLLSVMYAHHLGWNNRPTIGVTKIAEFLNWSPSRVCRAFRTLGNDHNWRSVTTKLPRLLQIKKQLTKSGKVKPYFSVLAVEYKGTLRRGTVQVARDFAEHFDIPVMPGFTTPIRKQKPIRSHKNDHSL